MKKIILLGIVAVIGSTFMLSCRNKVLQKNDDRIRYVLFIHVGAETAPALPLLIYTNENDSTYLRCFSMKEEGLKFMPYYYPIGESLIGKYLIKDMKKYHVADSVFNHISDFIINNPQADSFKELYAEGNFLVFFRDDTDSLTFPLDGEHYIQFFDRIREFIPEFDKSMPQRRK